MTTPPDFVPQPDLSDKRKRRISLRTLTDSFCRSAERFPITLYYLLAFTVWGVADCWLNEYFIDAPSIVRNIEPALWFLTITGMLLSLAVSLWCEHSGRKNICKKVQIVANLLLWADFAYMIFRFSNFTESVWIAHASVETALVVAIIFIPTVKRTPQRHNLMFSFAQFGNLISAAAIAVAMWIAVSIILFTIETLFGHFSFKIYLSAQIIFAAALSILIFIGRIPTFIETADLVENYTPAKFTTGIIKYILLPLTAIYMLILYVYGVKIITAGEMPKGVICFMVSALTAAVYMLLFMLKALGSTHKGEDRLTRVSLKIFPAAMLPLLVMMSMAIGQRIGQYGMTVDRLYVLTFNIWAYITAIYLFITRSRNINFVALSFAVIFVLTSIIPGMNYTSLVKSHMRSAVIRTLESAGIERSQLPLSHSEFEAAKEKMDDETWTDVKSKLRYLDSMNDHSQTNDIVKFDIQTGYYSYDPLFEEEITIEAVNYREILFSAEKGSVSVPEGYSRVKYLSKYKYNLTVEKNSALKFPISSDFDICLNMDSIRGLNDSINAPLTFRIDQASDSLFVVNSIEFSIDDEDYNKDRKINNLTVNGYLFTKQ